MQAAIMQKLIYAFAQVGIVAILTGTVGAHRNVRHAFDAAGNHQIHRARG